MRSLKVVLLIIAGVLFLPMADQNTANAGDPIVMFDPSDPEMNEAIRQARLTLRVFFEKLVNGEAESPSIKVAVPDGDDNAEHIWMSGLSLRDDKRLEATVANDPVYVTHLMKIGDRYAFTVDQISDWMYYRGEMIHGAYTLRVMLPRMPEDQADGFRSVLAPLP